jgi:hypothetical protein
VLSGGVPTFAEESRQPMHASRVSAAALFVLVTFGGAQAQTPADVSPKDSSCGDKAATMLILGTYHMDNPGQDAINLRADDVLGAKRQGEINELVERLARFKPTKIAVEAPYRNTAWPDRYQKFLAGEYKLGRNEIEQVGFRLAKQLGHGTVYPIDFPMWMNGLLPSEIEQPKAKPAPTPEAKPAEPKRALPPHLARTEELMRTATVTEVLRYLNSEPYVRADHAGYLEMLLPDEGVAIYARADLVTNWYKRNLRMFANLNRITEFPGDRVLLIVGSGHLKILSDLARDSPQFCLVEAETYLK